MSDDRGKADFWAVWEAASTMLPSRASPALRLGLTGEVAKSAMWPPAWNDLETRLAPGLRALGVRVECVSLPETGEKLIPLLRERLRRGIPVPVFAIDDTQSAPGRQGLVIRVEGEEVVWRETDGERGATIADLCGRFTHALRLTRTTAKGGRRDNICAALLRWIAFADAYPDRALTADAPDAVRRSETSAFLLEIAGKSRHRAANRLRRAAHDFAQANIESALAQLRAAVFLDLRLPALVQRALLLPSTEPLDDLERRELIYLARAGTRDLKTLAARRLGPERHRPDVRATLSELAYDPEPWVRDAAKHL